MSAFLKNCRRILSDVPTRLSNAGITSTEICESCHVNFNIIRKKYTCHKCARCFCSECLYKREVICKSCRVLNTWPVCRAQLQPLKARDIKAYLTANGVSTHGCVEKEELVELAMSHLGSRYQSNPIPPYSPQRVSSQVVDDSWVLINSSSRADPSSSSSGDTEPNAASNNASSASSPSCHLPPDPLPGSSTGAAAVQPPAIHVVAPPPVHIPEEAAEVEEALEVDDEPAPAAPAAASESIPIPAPRTTAHQLPPEEPMSTSLPQMPDILLNPLLANLMGAGHSGSQPNLNGSQPRPSTSSASSVPQRSTSETILSISRTDVSRMTDEELEKLPVKNLKILLTNHRIDFRGCCEKSELQERVKRLRGQLQDQSKIDVDDLNDESLCKVCMAAPIDCVLLDCGHLVTCTTCGKQMNECPICRQFVVRCVKIFRA